ncbi:MAG TPA: aminoacyl-tRNA hydrolase [Candidatus Anaerobutyricum stercoripullorum]|uniref:Peptidyl-tRNA hydrolase n=1 Tax=Candidatus Anaerobutyricum stercoripullorum TaxID=2838456 RepID=A0A9D1X5Z6_9FIRM|nr:aminoacyl-tRNA hydrolase [Candidatus Anaerobutyricum stercoripullorum]
MNTNKIFAAAFNFFRHWKVREDRVTLIEKLDTGGVGSLFDIQKECERRGLPLSFHVIRHADYEVSLRNLPGLFALFTKKAYYMATSAHIFLNDNFMPMAYMDIAPETTVVQLWHGMGSFKKFGGSTDLTPELREELREVNARVTHILASSEHIRKNYAEAFCVPEGKVIAIGCPQADYYFEKHDVRAVRARLEEQFPQMKGRKLALYAPTFRDDEGRDRELLSHFDFEKFERECGEEYCLAVRLHPQIQSSKVPENVPNLTGYPDVRELLLATDLLIADYSSIAVEYSLLGRPILLYAFDRRWYLEKDRGFYFDYESTAPGPVFTTMDDLCACIRERGWDLEKVKAFARLHNDYFDSQSARRVTEFYYPPGCLSTENVAGDANTFAGAKNVPGDANTFASAENVAGDANTFADAEIERKDRIHNMKIIAGLGNPTDQYKGTRHNVGFMAIDRLSDALGIAVNQHKHKAMTGSGFIAGQRVLLMKPLTYMNLSGESIRAAADFYKVEPEDILIIYDDISLEPGMLRIRKKGSAGGHNGIKSIIKHLGCDTFPRIRVGIGGEKHPGQDLADYVLGHFSAEEKEQLDEALDKAVKAAELIAADEIDEAMNRYSVGKKKRAKKSEEV